VSALVTIRRETDPNFGSCIDNPIVWGDDDPNDYETDVDCGSQRAENAESDGALSSSPETTFDSRTSVSPSPRGCHDIETAQHLRLSEQDAATSDPMQPHDPSSRPLSKLLHDRIDAEDHSTDCVRSESATFHPAPSCNQSPRRSRSSSLNQLSQEDNLHTSRSAVDEHEQARLSLDTHAFHEDRRRKDEKQKVSCGSDEEEEEEEEKEEVDDARPQRETNSAEAALMAKTSSYRLPRKMDEGTKPTGRQRSLPSHDSSSDPDQDARGSHGNGCSNDEFSSTHAESGEEDKRPCPLKRKRPSLSGAGPAQKKRKHHLQQRSTCQSRVLFKSHRQSPKSNSPRCHNSRVAAASSAKVQLPSPVPSAPHATDTDMSPDCSNPSSSDILPTLTEVTFRPYSPYCCSFAAVIRDNCDGQGVSFSQLTQLIESIGHVGKIDDFTIKPIEQHSFLLTGFSQHTPSQPSFGRATLSTAAEAGRNYVGVTRTRPQDGSAVDSGALASRRSEFSNSDDDGGLSDSDPESSSDDDGCLSEAEQGRSTTSKQSRWSDLDEQRLLAYKKEGKSWEWIFGKFPGRTRPAVRTRWNMIRPRVE
jgi:hypothetical protein